MILPVILLTGCTPKRVINNEIYTGRELPAADTTPAPSPSPPASSSTSPSLPSSSPGSGDFGLQAVSLAKAQLGKMYQWGAEGPDRFDCSGLVYFVYGNLGVPMPRVSGLQAKVGREVPSRELAPGDMLYFATSGSDINHVGIYLGHSKFLHAPRPGMPVRTDSMNNGWWKQKYRGARRIKG